MEKIAEFWSRVRRELFSVLEGYCGPLTEGHRRVIMVLEVVRIEEHVHPGWMRWLGRRPKDRKALARAFVTKACYDEPTTVSLVDRLRADRTLRRICGWETIRDLPSASTFSRAFREFAQSELTDRVHEALVKKHLGEDAVWHVSRDSTAIEAKPKRAVGSMPQRLRRTKAQEERNSASSNPASHT